MVPTAPLLETIRALVCCVLASPISGAASGVVELAGNIPSRGYCRTAQLRAWRSRRARWRCSAAHGTLLDTETQSARSWAAIPERISPFGNRSALCVVAAILGKVVSATLFDDERGRARRMGESKDGIFLRHWEVATTRSDHILRQVFKSSRDAESLARVGLVCKHDDVRGRGSQVEQVLTIARCSWNFVAVAFGKDLLFTHKPLSSQNC